MRESASWNAPLTNRCADDLVAARYDFSQYRLHESGHSQVPPTNRS
jgi:hypothetical protein